MAYPFYPLLLRHLGFRLKKRVSRALHTLAASIEHMSINHSGRHILVAQKLLHRTDIIAGFEQMRRKTVTKRMAATGFRNPTVANGVFNGTLKHAFGNMMAARDA